MNQSPFEHTTLSGSGSTMRSEGVEVRYPDVTRVLVPALVAMSGFIVPIILFFMLPSPLNIILAAVMVFMEFGTAAFLWWLFNSSFVRADESGVTKAVLGKTTTVGWDEIHTLELRQVGNGPTQIILKNASGQEIMTASNLNNSSGGERLLDYIESRLETRANAK